MEVRSGKSIVLWLCFVCMNIGMVAIGYEWGSKNHMKPADKAPDNNIHSTMARYMVKYGGQFNPKSEGYLYPSGPMNSLVYPVNGGLEVGLMLAMCKG